MAEGMNSGTVRNNRSRLPRFLERPIRLLIQQLAVHGEVSVGDDLRLSFGSRIRSFHGLRIGNSVSVGAGSIIEVDGEIGDYCLIARHVQIVGKLDHDISTVGVPIALSTWIGERSPNEGDVVTIGRDVWVGANSIILGGIKIGEGSIVGAGSVVTKSLDPYSIAVGNPARLIGRRFDSEAARAAHSSALDRR